MENDKLDSDDLEVLRSEYQKLGDDWRHINSIIWELPSIAVAMFTGILVAAYTVEGLPRIVSLSIGSLFLFAAAIEVLKKRHDLNIIGYIQQKLLAHIYDKKIRENLQPDKKWTLPIGLKEDVNDFHIDNKELEQFRDYGDPVFKLFYRSYVKQLLTYVILTAAISMAILAELEFFWYVEYYKGEELAYAITIAIGILAVIVFTLVIRHQRRNWKKSKTEKVKGQDKTST